MTIFAKHRLATLARRRRKYAAARAKRQQELDDRIKAAEARLDARSVRQQPAAPREKTQWDIRKEIHNQFMERYNIKPEAKPRGAKPAIKKTQDEIRKEIFEKQWPKSPKRPCDDDDYSRSRFDDCRCR